MSKGAQVNSRLGFILDDEDSKQVRLICMTLGISPENFLKHCIDVMWNAYERRAYEDG